MHTRRALLYRVLALGSVLSLAALPAALVLAQRPPAVAAASDLTFALGEIAEQFTRDTGQRVEVVFGSSGALTRQIAEGAPFELFLSADEAFIDQLARDGLARDRGTLYATGRIVLFAPNGSPLVPGDGLDGLARLLRSGRVGRFAIANPEVAPYGRAARSALQQAGLWEAIQPHLVLGDSVAQAAQFATTGNAVGGIIAHSLVLAPTFEGRGTFALVPESAHPPLRQRMALLTRAGPVTERFYRYLQQPDARAILTRYGFVLPE